MQFALLPRDIDTFQNHAHDFPELHRMLISEDYQHVYRMEWDYLHERRKELGKMKATFKARAEKKALREDEEEAYLICQDLIRDIDSEMAVRKVKGNTAPRESNIVNPVKDLPSGGGATIYYPDGRREFVSDTQGVERTSEWRSLFPGANTSQDDFRNIGEFFKAVASPHGDSRLKPAQVEARAQEEGIGAFGGFAVPPGFTTALMNKALTQNEVFRPRCLVIPMETPSVSAPYFDTEDRTGGSLFGLELKFYAEGQELDEQTAYMRSQTLKAKKGAVVWKCTRELLQDAPSFSVSIMNLLPIAIGNKLDYYFYEGNGAGRPLGVITSGSKLTVARNTPGSILYADVKNLWASMHPQCYQNSIWLINSKSIPSLLDLKDSNNNAIWFPGMSGSVKDGVPQTLFGRPVVYMESAPAVGSTGDIALIDPTQYVIAVRQEVLLESSNAPGFLTDTVHFRLTLRIDGQPMWSKPIKMEDGSTLSWACVLS